MWELDCEERWAPKNWCFWTVVLEKTLESPLDCKEIQPVHSEGDQPWVFLGKNDAKAETPGLWPPHAKSWLIGRKVMTNLDIILKSRDTTLPTKVLLVKAMVFPVVMYGWVWELDYKESWVSKNWCFWTVVLEKTVESSLDCKEIQPVHPKGIQSWIFIGRTDAEAEAPVIWPRDLKNWLTEKRPWWWERLKAGREGDDRGLDGWMASPIQWTRTWANSGRWWETGKPGVLQSMGSQRVGHNLASE